MVQTMVFYLIWSISWFYVCHKCMLLLFIHVILLYCAILYLHFTCNIAFLLSPSTPNMQQYIKILVESGVKICNMRACNLADNSILAHSSFRCKRYVYTYIYKMANFFVSSTSPQHGKPKVKNSYQIYTKEAVEDKIT